MTIWGGLLAVLMFCVSVLYTTVGHAGASGYLALMGLFGVAPAVMRPTALVLNIVVSCFTAWRFFAGRIVSLAGVMAVPHRRNPVGVRRRHDLAADSYLSSGCRCNSFRCSRPVPFSENVSAGTGGARSANPSSYRMRRDDWASLRSDRNGRGNIFVAASLDDGVVANPGGFWRVRSFYMVHLFRRLAGQPVFRSRTAV